MTLELEMSLDNSAFFNEDASEPARNAEIARIFRHLAEKIENAWEVEDGHGYAVMDMNGNKVGQLKIEGD